MFANTFVHERRLTKYTDVNTRNANINMRTVYQRQFHNSMQFILKYKTPILSNHMVHLYYNELSYTTFISTGICPFRPIFRVF